MDRHILRTIFKSYKTWCACGLLTASSNLFAYTASFNLSIDKYSSPYMGSDWMISGLHAYQGIDDIVASGTAGNTTCCMTMIRGGKWFLEFSLSSFAAVLQHEVFGHGARAREFNLPDIGYHINLYSGATTYPLQDFNALDSNQRAALVAGGVEATSILSQQIEIDWIREGSIDSRAATMYLVSSLDESVYVFGLDGNTLHPDNDSYSYIGNVNAWFGSSALTPDKLKWAVAWNWLDPMIYLSSWTLFKYIWLGYTTYDFCTLHIGNARFMPTTRTYLAPYGPEYHLLLNLYTPSEKYIGVNLRYGRTDGKSAAGVDLVVKPVTTNECFFIENKLSAWRQPHLLQNDTAVTNTPKWGFGEFLSLYYRLADSVFLKGELGYKVSGYIPGRQLAEGVYWGAGITFNVHIPTGYR